MSPTRYGNAAAPLGQPLHFQPCGRIAKNRFLKSPMAELMATWSPNNITERGIPTNELIELYRRWGEGKNNWGVIITGNIDIEFDALDSVGDMIITSCCPPCGHRFERYKKLAAAAKGSGSLIMGQVSHPGRQVWDRINPSAVSASDVQLESSNLVFGKPHAATKEEIAALVEGFAHAAEYLEAAGFDGVELHAAHGYLISQFLSRTTNLRKDEYGSQTIENRLRFISDIVKTIRARVSPGFVVAAKRNSVEFQSGGVTPEEAKQVCEKLETLGIDFVELSGGTYEKLGMTWERESTRKREAFFIEWAEAVIKSLGPQRRMKAYMAGGLRSVAAMVQTLDVVDGVALARPATAEPRLPVMILENNVSGAIRPVESFETDFFASKVLAETQMRQISESKEPIDSSDANAMEHFQQDRKYWAQEQAKESNTWEDVRAVEFTGTQAAYGVVV